MFTGLVEALGVVRSCEAKPPGLRLTVAVPKNFAAEAVLGESVAVNGCCLTVVDFDVATLTFDVGDETLRRTNLGHREPGSNVNLERALRLGDRLGGHLVSGHIDGVGRLAARVDKSEWADLRFELPPALAAQVVSKGSIAVDGISLTVVDVGDDFFTVMLIPHTLASTTLGQARPGDAVNLETDLFAKYVERRLGFLPGMVSGSEVRPSAT